LLAEIVIVYDPAAREESELREMVVVPVSPEIVQEPESIRPVGTVRVGSVQPSALISVTDRVAVPGVPIFKLLFEMLALKAGVGVSGATDIF
jgi:hypothetical protein